MTADLGTDVDLVFRAPVERADMEAALGLVNARVLADRGLL